jgi:tetratricopeptide (TPR) repeat protein
MAGARLAPLTHEDRELIKRALLETDNETRRCVGPLLALEPVQYALLSFVKDPSRSFEDHVWDPVTQTVLNRLRSTGIDRSDSQVETNSVFETELMQCARGGGAVVEITDTDKEAELLAEVDNTQADGKTKFKRGDHYAAMNAFKKSVLALLAYHEDQNYGKVYDPQEWDEEELRQRYVTLCCNVAVCAIKLRDCAMIRLYATKALRVDEHSSKAIYALAKVNLLEHRFEDSRAEAQKGLGLYPGNDQFAKLLRDIDAVELRQVEDRVDMLAVKELTEKVDDEAQKRREQEEAAHRAKLERAAEVTPLPTLQFGEAPFQQLNIYFMRIKQSVSSYVDIFWMTRR